MGEEVAKAGPLSGRLMRGAGLMVGMRWVMRFLGIINVGILARILVPEDFGLIAMAMVIAGLVDGLLNAGLDRAILQRGHGTRDFYDTAWTIRLCQILLVAAAIAALAGPAARYYDEPRVELILWVSALGSVFRSADSLGVVLLRQQLRFKREAAFQVSVQIIGVVVTIALALYMRNYQALVLSLLIKEVTQTVLSYVFAPYAPRLTLKAWRDLLSFSQWSLILNVVVSIYARLANLIVGRVADADAVGRLSITVELALTPTSEIASPIMRTFFPGFVKLRDDKERYRSAFLAAFAAMALIGSAMCVGLALVAAEFVAIVLGAKWLSVIPLVQVMAVAGLCRIVEMFFIEQNFVFARIKAMTLLFAILAVILASLIAPAHLRFGLEGVTMLILIFSIASATATGAIAARAADIPALLLLRCLVRPLLSAAAMSAGVLAFDAVVDLPVLLMFLMKAGIGAALYVATAALLWHLDGRPNGFEARIAEKLGELRARFAPGG
jgi:lipopolysaccharide exporter